MPLPEPRASVGWSRTQKWAVVLIALGVIGVLWGVFHVLETANGPGTGPKVFAQRRSYNQVKVAVHESLPGGVLRAALGATLWYLGVRTWRRSTAAR